MKGYTNKTFEPTFNPKKHNKDKRKARRKLGLSRRPQNY